MSNSVWANKIDSVIDLVIVDTDSDIVKTVSVFSTLLVEVNRTVTFIEQRDKKMFYVVYEYDRDGIKREISVEQISQEEENGLKLKP